MKDPRSLENKDFVGDVSLILALWKLNDNGNLTAPIIFHSSAHKLDLIKRLLFSMISLLTKKKNKNDHKLSSFLWSLINESINILMFYVAFMLCQSSNAQFISVYDGISILHSFSFFETTCLWVSELLWHRFFWGTAESCSLPYMFRTAGNKYRS